jgi:NitT/TauT family transport system substrate-binding protein
MQPSRRSVLKTVGLTGALLARPALLRAQALPRVTTVALATGFSVILTEYMVAKRFDKKHGVDIDVINSYASVTNYYNDFTAGTFELGIGSWDTWAARFLAGVPLRLVCTINNYDILYLIAKKGGPASVDDLRGKTVAATLSSGAYRIAKLALRQFHKLDAEKDLRVQNVESPAAAVALVMAGAAEAGLTWEPNISVGMEREPALTTIYNVGQDFARSANVTLPYFSLALRNEAEARYPGVSARIAAAFEDCITTAMANIDEVVALAAPKMKVSEAALKLALTSKRLTFEPLGMQTPRGRETILGAAEYLYKNGVIEKPLDADFLASS